MQQKARKTAPASAKPKEASDDSPREDRRGFPDPAAAPLRTDPVAGGSSPGAEELSQAQSQEADERSAADPYARLWPATGNWFGIAVVIAALIVILLFIAL
jgi:hypothetical protein